MSKLHDTGKFGFLKYSLVERSLMRISGMIRFKNDVK